MTDSVKEEQRGKRKMAKALAFILVLVIGMALFDVGASFKVLELILPYAVFLIVALMGLDAHFNPKRV